EAVGERDCRARRPQRDEPWRRHRDRGRALTASLNPASLNPASLNPASLNPASLSARPRLASAFRIVLFVVLLTGCRAVLGVDTLELTDGGADAGQGDAAADADARPSGDGGDAAQSCAAQGVDCRKCCRDALGDRLGDLEQIGLSTGCLCGANGICK